MYVHCFLTKVAALPNQPLFEIDGNHVERVTSFKCSGLELKWDALTKCPQR